MLQVSHSEQQILGLTLVRLREQAGLNLRDFAEKAATVAGSMGPPFSDRQLKHSTWSRKENGLSKLDALEQMIVCETLGLTQDQWDEEIARTLRRSRVPQVPYMGRVPSSAALPAVASGDIVRGYSEDPQAFAVSLQSTVMHPLYPPGTVLVAEPVSNNHLASIAPDAFVIVEHQTDHAHRVAVGYWCRRGADTVSVRAENAGQFDPVLLRSREISRVGLVVESRRPHLLADESGAHFVDRIVSPIWTAAAAG